MAHDLDITDGQASFVSARQDAWHHLGTVLDDAFTAEEAMTAGHLGGWNVRKTPMLADLTPDEEEGSVIEMPGVYGVVRDNPVTPGQVDPLGVVGGTYTPVQNEDHAEFLNTLVEESGAHFDTAGALRGGRRVFITMKLPDHISVGGVDRVDQYIAAVNSHDGSSSFRVMVTPVRIVCQNTLNLAWGGASHTIKVRHTPGAQKSIVTRARQTLDMTFKYLDGFQREAEQLINTPMTAGEFGALVDEAYGPDDQTAPHQATRKDQRVDEIMQLFTESYTHEGVRDTAWAGLNALTEWYDHFSEVRSATPSDRRAEAALFYPKFKDQARRLILSAV